MTTATAWEPESGTAERVNDVRLKLYDAADDLRKIDGPAELLARLQAVAQEVYEIQAALRLLIHVTSLEEGDFLSKLEEIDDRLAAGDWEPDGAPVDGVVDRLRAALASRD
jgi:hypothetical protein